VAGINRVIFTAWMGHNPMSTNRSEALLSIVRNTGCPMLHVTPESLTDWVDPAVPLHPLFPLLSAVHKTDYFRAYAMHVHGGGYTDIKHTTKPWKPFFEALEASPAYGLGYREIGPHGIAPVGGAFGEELRANFDKIIGVCSMIFRPRTHFTASWLNAVNNQLNAKAQQLIDNPARHPQDQTGVQFSDGSVSSYPFAWTELLGNIFHPLAYQAHQAIVQAEIEPSFENYR